MKITYKINSVIEQQIEISKLSLHLQERIYDFINKNEFVSEGDDLITISDMKELQGTVKATIDKKGNINCLECKNCTDCTGCSRCDNCTDCTGCSRCDNCKNCDECQNCFACENCANCTYCDYKGCKNRVAE